MDTHFGMEFNIADEKLLKWVPHNSDTPTSVLGSASVEIAAFSDLTLEPVEPAQ